MDDGEGGGLLLMGDTFLIEGLKLFAHYTLKTSENLSFQGV